MCMCVYVGLILGQCVYGTDNVHILCVCVCMWD
jgi:hypothetical protein